MLSSPLSAQTRRGPLNFHPAKHYKKLPEKSVQCKLCPRECRIIPGQRGYCGVRKNQNGELFSLNYGYPAARNNDPIEKKPLFHVYPGSRSYSIAAVGCNMSCRFCQNWEISQAAPEDFNLSYVAPAAIAQSAKDAGAATVAYTYSEPTVFHEYVIDCCRAASELGLGNVLITNGWIQSAPLETLCNMMTAIKVDFKAFSPRFYQEICGGELKGVQNTLKQIKASGTWLELVVLLIPTLNDQPDEIKRMSEWIVKELGPDVPLHFTRFHPAYRLRNLPPTPPATLANARKLAREAGCRFVYTGNLPGQNGENTYCPACETVLVRRYGHIVMDNSLKANICPACKAVIPGVWS